MGWLPPSCVPYHYFEYNSSPRERGKLNGPLDAPADRRLIPAWAGKTDNRGGRLSGFQAHPRAGGENRAILWAASLLAGSSARGRGKPSNPLGSLTPGRLIPARAGKTTFRPAHAPREPAHPRAGGETGSFPVATDASSAHPRAGGENAASSTPIGTLRGSSPRGRGKLDRLGRHALHLGLIPAWAGKTPRVGKGRGGPGAHPRVGGENVVHHRRLTRARGSSPHGRGKLTAGCVGDRRSGLIPARAGKTAPCRSPTPANQAHPRAGGEN